MGLGVGPGHLGRSVDGAMLTYATMSVYHRYIMYSHLMHLNRFGNAYRDPYYSSYYYQGQCEGGCPINSRCEYGFCNCLPVYTQINGQCYRQKTYAQRAPSIKPFIACMESSSCHRMDINLICNTNLTSTGDEGRCECRRDMRWNSKDHECQFYLDVDCSNYTYESQPTTTVLDAVNQTLEDVGDKELNANPNPSPEQTLKNSLLSNIDPENATENEIKEAFCRDIDSFSWEFGGLIVEDINAVQNTIVNVLSVIIFWIVALVILGFVVHRSSCLDKCRHDPEDDESPGKANAEENVKPRTGIAIPSSGYQPPLEPIPEPVDKLPYSVQPNAVQPFKSELSELDVKSLINVSPKPSNNMVPEASPLQMALPYSLSNSKVQPNTFSNYLPRHSTGLSEPEAMPSPYLPADSSLYHQQHQDLSTEQADPNSRQAPYNPNFS